MVNNLTQRILSGIFLGGALILAIFTGGIVFQLLMSLCVVLMLYEWLSINANKRTKLFFWGCFYIIIPFLFWMYESRYFPEETKVNIFFVFSIVWTCDIFAYLGGKFLGGPKFAPKISPKKTWSGVIVGSIFALLTSYIFISKFKDGDQKLFFSSILIVVASVLGDLIESKVKRVLNVKDSGNIIPGHGGICDRLDSFLLATYVFILIKYIIL